MGRPPGLVLGLRGGRVQPPGRQRQLAQRGRFRAPGGSLGCAPWARLAHPPVLPCAAVRAGEGGGVPAGLQLHSEENRTLAPLAVATLRALLAFSPDAFRAHLKDFFPLLTALISCEYAPPEVQRALSELFAKRIGPMLAS